MPARVKLIVDLFYEGGITRMHEFINETAQGGDPHVDANTHAQMKKVLTEIQDARSRASGSPNAAGNASYKALKQANLDHPIEAIGKSARQHAVAGDRAGSRWQTVEAAAWTWQQGEAADFLAYWLAQAPGRGRCGNAVRVSRRHDHAFHDALHGAPGLKHVLVRHSAAFAANRYAPAGALACVATSVRINLVTGIADAMLDSVPMVVITGQVPTHLMGTDAFRNWTCSA
jgi:hypothetical protein